MRSAVLWNWANYLSDRPRISYSMAGEDQVLFHIIKYIAGGKPISWINIGAAHPIILNDTYLFYRSKRYRIRGRRPYGVSVDARPHLNKLYRVLRPREIFINCLIGDGDLEVQDFFYNPYEPHNSSTNENWARGLDVDSRIKNNQDIRKISSKVMSLHEIFLSYPRLLNSESGGNFCMLLVDTEGHDLSVLQSNDFKKYRPSLVAVEIAIPTYRGLENITLESLSQSKIHKFMVNVGYSWYAGNGMTQFYLEGLNLR